jgi:amidohydrolase
VPGAVGILRRGSGPTLGIRADIDALPINETTGLDHASQHPGKMHACGHDGHTAILLGAAMKLRSFPFVGTLILIFQPAEETAQGAKAMLDSGVLDGLEFDAVLGLHNWPDLERGKIAVHSGPVMASADRFELTFKGRPHHPAQPENGDNVIGAMAATVQAFQEEILAKRVEASRAVVTVTEFNGDGQRARTAALGTIAGTIRCLSPAARSEVLDLMRMHLNAIAERYHVSVSSDLKPPCPACINDNGLAELASRTVAECFGQETLIRNIAPTMGTDDFGWFSQRQPALYLWIGGGSPHSHPLHSSKYDFDDSLLETGVRLWVEMSRRILG